MPALLLPDLVPQLVGNASQRALLAAIADPGAYAIARQDDEHRGRIRTCASDRHR